MNFLVRHLSASAVALIGASLLVSCSESGANKADSKPVQKAIPVSLGAATVLPMPRGVEVTGTLAADEVIVISAKVAGRIDSYQADIGQRVSRTAVLAQIDPTDYRLAVTEKQMSVAESLAKLGLTDFPGPAFQIDEVPTVRRALQQAANAKARYGRIRELHDQKPPMVSDQDFADVETAYQVANSELEVARLAAKAVLAEARTKQAELAGAQQRLMDTTIRAQSPAATQAAKTADTLAITERLVAQGDYVREGTPMFRLVVDDPLRLRLPVPERFVGRVKEGQSVSITVQAHADTFTGTVVRISPEIDSVSRAFTVEAEFANADRRLKPGAFAKATILTDPEARSVFVPANAVVSFAGVHRVYSAVDGKAKENRVELGVKRNDAVEITRGLKGDERLILTPPNQISPGTPIEQASAATKEKGA